MVTHTVDWLAAEYGVRKVVVDVAFPLRDATGLGQASCFHPHTSHPASEVVTPPFGLAELSGWDAVIILCTGRVVA